MDGIIRGLDFDRWMAPSVALRMDGIIRGLDFDRWMAPSVAVDGTIRGYP